jgi:DNA-directed RNA polymerase subunit omega
MARVTVEDCLEEVDNRFAVVLLGARRTRQLLKGATPLVDHHKNKSPVIALREIAAGKVRFTQDPREIVAIPAEELRRLYGERRTDGSTVVGIPMEGNPSPALFT